MKVSLYDAGGTLDGGFTMPGMTLTGPLLLSGSVGSPSEAVHKQYVDTAATNLDAANIVSGTIATARLPGLIGDVASSNSSNSVVLNLSGVIAGDYTKVTVDVKGRVTVGLSLTEADLPSVSWGKIVTGKPTTLSGYNINDGVSTVNGVITGNLTLSGAPLLSTHAATKQYADANAAGGVKIVTGDIVGQVTNVTPSGFLRCNGGILDKTASSTLYAVIGDAFTGGNTQPGSGKPFIQQYQFNNTQVGDITGWAATTAIPAVLAYSQAIVTKSRVYLLGGWNGSAGVNTVYTAAINSDGTLGAWTNGTSLPAVAYYGQAIVTKNRVHLIVGCGAGGYTNVVYTAPINPDGTLGTWTSGSSLPGNLGQSQAILTTGRVYVLGGYVTGPGGPSTTVYTAPVNADGTLGTWTTGTPLPLGLSDMQAIVTKNRVYLLGGINVSGARVSSVYTAVINTDGTLGTWTVGTPLPVVLSESQAFVTKNQVYLFGGVTSTFIATVYIAPINSDGTLGTWVQGTSFPESIGRTTAIASKNKIYTFGGYLSGFSSKVYMATISGSLNDYSSYYDGTITIIDVNSFKLPDYSTYEKTSLYFYIKS